MSRPTLLGNLPVFESGPNSGRLDRRATSDRYGFTYKQIFKAYNNWIQIFRYKESSLTFEEYLNKLVETKINPDNVGNNLFDYHLSRFNDEGPYTKDSCRFIFKSENLAEEFANYGYIPWNNTVNKYGIDKAKEFQKISGKKGGLAKRNKHSRSPTDSYPV